MPIFFTATDNLVCVNVDLRKCENLQLWKYERLESTVDLNDTVGADRKEIALIIHPFARCYYLNHG